MFLHTKDKEKLLKLYDNFTNKFRIQFTIQLSKVIFVCLNVYLVENDN